MGATVEKTKEHFRNLLAEYLLLDFSCSQQAISKCCVGIKVNTLATSSV